MLQKGLGVQNLTSPKIFSNPLVLFERVLEINTWKKDILKSILNKKPLTKCFAVFII